MSRIVVSIINYRTADLTLKCAQSVIEDISGISASIMIVDNFSNDGSAEIIEEWIREKDSPVPITIVRSQVNLGFSGGHNLAWESERAEFYLVLNSDTLIVGGFFTALLASVATKPKAGIFAPKITSLSGNEQISCFRFPTPVSELIRGAGTSIVTSLLDRYDLPLSMPRQADQVEWASFACVLLRQTMISEIGSLDEGYFLYFEDTEYCWRARQAGWSISFVPDARIVHFRGGSGPVKTMQSNHSRLPGYYYASRTRFFRQSYGISGLFLANLMWFAGRAIARCRRLFGKSVSPANKDEIRDIWINFLSPLGGGKKGQKD